MKLPKTTAEGGFMIGNQKFALYSSLVFLPIDEHEDDAAILIREGEVASIYKTADTEDPFKMEVAYMIPHQIHAGSIETAAMQVAADIIKIGTNIIEHQLRECEPGNPAQQGCCDGHCEDGPDCSKAGEAILEEIERARAVSDDETPPADA